MEFRRDSDYVRFRKLQNNEPDKINETFAKHNPPVHSAIPNRRKLDRSVHNFTSRYFNPDSCAWCKNGLCPTASFAPSAINRRHLSVARSANPHQKTIFYRRGKSACQQFGECHPELNAFLPAYRLVLYINIKAIPGRKGPLCNAGPLLIFRQMPSRHGTFLITKG